MNCKHQKDIPKWVEGELKDFLGSAFEKHFVDCVVCQKEVEWLKKLNQLIFLSAPSIEPSPNFDGIFWQKVLQREKESWVAKVLRGLDAFIPTPNFSQILAILLVAFFMGGTGGLVATVTALAPESRQSQRESIQFLSGFKEFAGIPSSSVAASYLKTARERKIS